MSGKIRIGICGYGNLGRGVEAGIAHCGDMELVAFFSRRELQTKTNAPVVHIDDAAAWKNKIDVMILCGGSANDLPVQGPAFAKIFNTVDSFDTHAKIPEYLQKMDAAAKSGGNISIVSIGWDPGLFSLMRLYMGALIPNGQTYTFWGKGVSQGHSEAVRGIDGVIHAIQYTVPSEIAMQKIRNGKNPSLTTREKHTRECFVVASDSADRIRIENEIKNMPNYFSDYDTTVNFISAEEFKKNHGDLPHGGNVIHIGKTGDNNNQTVEFSLRLDSNPEFTASVLLCYARAAYRLSQKGERGAKTIFEIAPIFLSASD
ncbi:MAG: diaminopimelate dehydrogenase, partial [Defluviitaleaceae bacterium]|nr:diaminopimelate dehydrogenase [Defluviitaleaceae bacterium]